MAKDTFRTQGFAKEGIETVKASLLVAHWSAGQRAMICLAIAFILHCSLFFYNMLSRHRSKMDGKAKAKLDPDKTVDLQALITRLENSHFKSNLPVQDLDNV
ncbi:hypothetical protein CANMA_003423, partial [Candida margitis]|uniref:uncharacterized protein n=1 Tax=Candida margitis TaxID=1775924 RepID=UPI0022276372